MTNYEKLLEKVIRQDITESIKAMSDEELDNANWAAVGMLEKLDEEIEDVKLRDLCQRRYQQIADETWDELVRRGIYV